MRKLAIHFKIKKGEKASIYMRSAAGRGFTVSIIGPGYISAVTLKLKKSKGEVKWV